MKKPKFHRVESTGIFTREVMEPVRTTCPKEMAHLLKQFAELTNVDRILADWETWAVGHLEAENLPSSIAELTALDRSQLPPLTRDAVGVLRGVHDVRAHIDAGNIKAAVFYALLLGSTTTRAGVRQWEPAAKLGESTASRNKALRQLQLQEQRPERERRDAAICEHAQKLLARGKSERELVGILGDFADRANLDWPRSRTALRNILVRGRVKKKANQRR